jgi:hypothetical protein
MKTIVALLLLTTPAFATTVTNQDAKAQTLTVVANNVSSKYTIRGGGQMVGLCGAETCTFKIKGSTITAGRDARVVIKNGRLSVQ